MLNRGKIQVGDVSTPAQISYGSQSPVADATALTWNTNDFRYYIGPVPYILGWRCTAGGTPGTWRIVMAGGFDLFLSYGNQNGDGALPTPAEATPSFFLRPNTDKTVQMSFSGSPGAIWEYEVGEGFDGIVTFDTFIYSCGLSTGTGLTPTLTLAVTADGTSILTTPNLDGSTNARVVMSTSFGLSAGQKTGVKCVTTNLGSGFLMATTHVSIR